MQPLSIAQCVANSLAMATWRATAPRFHASYSYRALKLLSLLERNNGGRWDTITADFGNKPIKPFTPPSPLDHQDTTRLPICPPPPPTHMPIRMVDANEGNSFVSLTPCPAVLPEDLLPSSLRPPARKPNFIRILEPRFIGHTNARCRFSSIEKIQIGEWKYCTDNNLPHTAQLIRSKYTPSPMPSDTNGQALTWKYFPCS
jgi:hypothetical protein